MAVDMKNFIKPAKECLKNTASNSSPPYCEATWDTITCWPPTLPGFTAKQLCPDIFGAPDQRYVYRKCESSGSWSKPEMWKGFGFSDYGECIDHISIIEEVFEIEREIESDDPEVAYVNLKKTVAVIVLLSISLVCVLISIVGSQFMLPKIQTHTVNSKISKHLFVAVFLEASIHLIEKCLVFNDATHHQQVLMGTQYLCESLIIMSELACVVVAMWVLIKTHNLHLVAKSERLCMSGYLTYCLLGWAIPIIPVTIWAVTSSLSHRVTCWTGYQAQAIIWIIGVPKLLMILTALSYLIMTFQKMSKNVHNLQKNCTYRRTYLDTIGTAIFIVYICLSFFMTVLHSKLSAYNEINRGFEIVCLAQKAMEGMVLSLVHWSFNADVRKFLETKARRISRQQLVPTVPDELEL